MQSIDNMQSRQVEMHSLHKSLDDIQDRYTEGQSLDNLRYKQTETIFKIDW